MALRILRLQDRLLFDTYASRCAHQLAAYAFANVYIWKALYAVTWQIIDGALCIFYRDHIGCFMPLPPLGKSPTAAMINGCFAAMDAYNKNPAVSRIENIEAPAIAAFERLGLAVVHKSCDYLCETRKIAQLQGDPYKSERAACNYFMKHNVFTYRALESSDTDTCRALYTKWMHARAARSADAVYRGMLEDSFQALDQALRHMRALGYIGRVIEADGAISAFTLGCPISKDVFCVAYETVDPGAKGAAQYIFREFAKEMIGYQYINIMDDLGLPNLRAVKLAYHPSQKALAYIAERKASRE